MAEAYLFTEEGRASRGSNFLLLTFVALWLAVSCAAGYGIFYRYTKGNFTVLQRVYWNQYWWGSLRAFLNPFEPKSTYVFLSRDVVVQPADQKNGAKDRAKNRPPEKRACLDEEIIAMYDEDGYIHRNPDGKPDVRLKADYSAETIKFYWDDQTVKDSIARAWFRDHFYEGKTVTEFYYPGATGAGLLFVFGIGGAFGFRRYRTRRLLKGKVLRGTRELTPKQYEREMRREAHGIGIEVFEQEGR